MQPVCTYQVADACTRRVCRSACILQVDYNPHDSCVIFLLGDNV